MGLFSMSTGARGYHRFATVLAFVAIPSFGRRFWRHCLNSSRVTALRDSGRIDEAAALALQWLEEKDVTATAQNFAADVLISAGHYRNALKAEPAVRIPSSAQEM